MKRVMHRYLLAIVLVLIGWLSMATPTAAAYTVPTTVYVAQEDFKGDACGGLTSLNSANDCNGGHANGTISRVIRAAVFLLSVIAGVAAVIMIILAGIKYITANGDSQSISSAKTTLIYAIVGLIIAAFAQFIVQFVLNKTTGT